ncbi:MAG: hypothetical protein V8Q75_03360 [Bacilli bacterium]
MKHRTLQEYKEEVFDELTEEKKLQYMYDMSKQLCHIAEFVKERQSFQEKWNDEMYKRILRLLGEDNA